MDNCSKCRSSSECSEHRQSGIRNGIEGAPIQGGADKSMPPHESTSSAAQSIPSIITPGLVMMAYPPVRVVSDCSMEISRSLGAQNVIVTSPSTYTMIPGTPAPAPIAQKPASQNASFPTLGNSSMTVMTGKDGAQNAMVSSSTRSSMVNASDTPAPAAPAQPMMASLRAPGQDEWLEALRNSSMALIAPRSEDMAYPPISSVCTSRGCMTLSPKRLTVQTGNCYITVKPSTPLGSLPTDSSVVFLEQRGLPSNTTSKTNFILPSAPESYAIAKVLSTATSSTVTVKGNAMLVTPKTKRSNERSGKITPSDANATSNSLTRPASDHSRLVSGNAAASKKSSLTPEASAELKASMSAPSVVRPVSSKGSTDKK